jgi:hypothetical protein
MTAQGVRGSFADSPAAGGGRSWYNLGTMAQDPYGFPEGTTPAAPSDVSTAMWLGVSACMLASVGVCMMYLPYFVALPLGATAVYRAWPTFTGAAQGDAKDKQMATVAVVSGGVSAAISGMFALFALLYFLFLAVYMIIIFGALAAGMPLD